MQLGGGANEHQALMAGKYTKANELSSEMPYWMHSDGTYALWFTQGSWRMGTKSNLGTQTSGIKAPGLHSVLSMLEQTGNMGMVKSGWMLKEMLRCLSMKV